LKQLDALRAAAILLVVGRHVTGNPIWYRFGWTGADLFFVLSGFLISGRLFREYKSYGSIQIVRFFIRRGLKIYPAYYALVLGTVAAGAIAKAPIAWHRIWPDLIFAQSYLEGTWGHLWSLAVEEHFYLLLPLTLWVMLKRRPEKRDPFDRVPLACAAVSAACLLLRSVHLVTGEAFSYQGQMFATHARLDTLSFGVLLSYFWEFNPRVIDRLFEDGGRSVLTLSLFLLLPALLFEPQHPFMHTVGFSLLYVGYGGLLLCCLKRLDGRGIIVRGLARLGVYSYTIYLCHRPLSFWCVGDLTTWSPERIPIVKDHVFLFYVVLSIAAGVIMAKLIELPVLRLRDRLLPAQAGMQITAPSLHSKPIYRVMTASGSN